MLDAGSFSKIKMSEKAERPVRSRPRNGSEGAADRLECEITAADLGQKVWPTASGVLITAVKQHRAGLKRALRETRCRRRNENDKFIKFVIFPCLIMQNLKNAVNI